MQRSESPDPLTQMSESSKNTRKDEKFTRQDVEMEMEDEEIDNNHQDLDDYDDDLTPGGYGHLTGVSIPEFSEAPKAIDFENHQIAYTDEERARSYVQRQGPIIAENFDFTPGNGPKRAFNTFDKPLKRNKGKGPVTLLDQIEQSDECIATARDLLIKAAHLTDSRSKRTKILDLLNIFREYLEKDGNLPRDAPVLSAQLQ